MSVTSTETKGPPWQVGGEPASPHVVLEARPHTPSPTPQQVCEGHGGSQASPGASGSIGGLGVFFFLGMCSPFSLKVLIA